MKTESKTARKQRQRRTQSAQIRNLTKITGVDAKTLKKAFLTGADAEREKLKGIKKARKRR